VAPGDDCLCGKASRLRLRVLGKTRRVKVTGSIPGGRRFTVRLSLPRRPRTLAVRAVDDGENAGPVLVVRLKKR
jgi:hypothetical protein